MFRTIKKIIFLTLLCNSFFLLAQTTLSGNIIESESGLPMAGVNIIIKNTNKGVVSDFDGKFEIDVNSGNILLFSYVGFMTEEIQIFDQKNITVKMIEDTSSLEEIVIIGYGSVKKKDLTGAADLITTKDFNKGPILSPQQLLTGKIAGVNVTSGSGAPGDGQIIRIRGTGSLSLSSNPLYVIDGIPLNDGGVGGTRNPLNLINPNDIESMVVLKDASATAIYGSRASNGVIIITTKSAKSGSFKYEVNLSNTNHVPVDKVSVLNSNQFRTLVSSLEDENATNLIGQYNTNWQDEIYSNCQGKDFSISANGAISDIPTRISIGLTNHDGVLLGDNFERKSFSLNISPEAFDGKLKININNLFSFTQNNFSNRGAIGSALSYDPTQPIYDENSPYGGYHSWIDPNSGSQYNLAPTNPLALLNLTDDISDVHRYVINAKINYDFDFLEGLSGTLKLSIDNSKSQGRFSQSEFLPNSDSDFNGSLSTYENKSINKLLDAFFNYETTLLDVHNISSMLGYSYQSFEFDNFSYNSEDEEQGNDFEFIDKSMNVLLSYFGRINYNFDDRYLLTATLRADASSKLNPEDRWGLFPSFALAWNIHNEDFFKASIFDEFKVRFGYGEVGNVNGLGDYRFLTRYSASTSSANYQFGNSFYQTFRPEPINNQLRWEVGKTVNFGLDFKLFSSRVFGTLNLYKKITNDLIAFAAVDPFTNFGNRIDKNIGDMENSGFEFMMNTIVAENNNLKLNLGFNVTLNENKVTYLPFDQPTGGISGGVGNNIQQHTEGQTPNSFFVFEQVYDDNGVPVEGEFVDRNQDGLINNDDKFFYKSPFADMTAGFNTNITYKNWDFNMVARASLGNYAYNNVASSRSYQNVITQNDGFLNNLHSSYLQSDFESFTEQNLLSSYFIQDASFIKVDNITLGYTFKIDDLSNLRIYTSMQNVLTLTKYDGIDPEIFGGIDNNFYPRPQSFLVGLTINFQ